MAEEVKESLAVVDPIKAAIEKAEPQAANLSRLAAFTPTNLTEAIALSKLIASSDLAPKDYKGKPGNVLIAMQMAAELGVAPMQGLANIAVINGRASVWGDLALALVQVHPGYEWHKEWVEGQGDSRKAVFQIKRKGQEAHTATFTVAQAKEAKLWGKRGYNGQDTPWITHPDRMLAMRARGFGLRDKFADALRGMILAEEAMDIPIDTTAAKKLREEASLDVSTLTQSSEPNRGHSDTGLQRTDEQTQAPAKPDKVMCADCGVIDGHKPECKYYGKQTEQSEQDRRTSKPTIKAAYLVLAVEKRKKKAEAGKEGQPFLVLHCVTPEDKQIHVAVWHQGLHEFFPVGKFDKPLVCEVSQSKNYFQLEHIIELAGVKYVNDKPAAEGTMPAERESGADDEFELEGE